LALSPSHTANSHYIDPASLSRTDVVLALLLHILVLSVISVLAYWQGRHAPEPMHRVEVMMISAKELAKLEHPKPAAKPRPQKPKPEIKPDAKLKPGKQKAEEFDPFAPVESSSDVKEASTSQPELADIAGKQLSQQEMDRYIAMIQAAVQRNWKVPASVNYDQDPLVEMRLQPSGEVAGVRILESSGNAALDASLIRAIQAAAPFTLPQQQFEAFRINTIRFHPLK